MTPMPRVSVLMPVYNAQRYVAEAVESILQQSFGDFELLITDDGSCDRSLKILQSYACKDSRIRLRSQINRGLTRTLNAMIQDARGEYIAILEHDDVALPNRLADELAFLDQHPEVVCVSGAQDLIDEAGRFLTCLQLPQTNAEIQQAALAGHGSMCHPGVMMRRSALLQVGGYNETMGLAHDLDLWLRLGEIGELANLPQPVVRYRLHSASLSEKYCGKQRQEAYLACEQAWKRRGIEGHFEAKEPWRPGKDRRSRHKFMLQYGWWAFTNGQKRTALIYGFRAIYALPFTPEGWKLLITAAFKSGADCFQAKL
ncbi:glycosyltransferase family 2 protein [Leptodesmis sp.]|uniref:glycosyltransferase family 2 protein n=1 Tax=Leptodesmis sp. TaxID=3100501 RepID=UPI0040534ACB